MRSVLDNNSLSSDQNTNLFLVGLSRRPGNLLNPTNPLATDDSSGRTRVPNLITQPQVGRLLVFHFKTRDTQPEPNHLSFLTKYYEFPTKSNEIWPDFDGSCQISDRSRRIQPDFDLGDKPKTNSNQPKTNETWTKNPTKSLGQFRAKFLSTCLIKVKSEFGTNPTWPNLWTALIFDVSRNYTPNFLYNYQRIYQLS